MIQAHELRKNNWVLDGNTPVQVTEILSNVINHSLADGCPYDELNPIPLSPDILEKCGFEKTKKGNVHRFYWGSLDRMLFIGFYENGIYPTLVKEGEMVSDPTGAIMLNKIYYLHQLQNLIFCLTGNELTYKP